MKTYIIQSKNSHILQNSSSGGMFAELARYVFSKGGVVFGCTMERVEDGFDVKHIYIENENDLYKLQGSKYVQSRIGNTIKEAKEFLDEGRFVLFSGTPCQIAGLKAYLKRDYDNLLTVDLSCEGTPPLEIFNDYIKYLEKNVLKSQIIDFKFRSKKHFGWSTSGFVAIYKKNNEIKEKVLPQNISSYFTYFLHADILQKRCFSCKYAGLDRISDITIADAWGVENQYYKFLKENFSKNNGISLVIINSPKGESCFRQLSDIRYASVDICYLKAHNHPLRHPSVESKFRTKIIDIYNKNGYFELEKYFRRCLGWKYYYYIIKNHTPKIVKNIIKCFIPRKTNCLLMTLYCLNNYGSLLTAFSLYKTIKKLGYNGKLIHYGNLYGYGKSFIKRYLPITNRCVNNKDFFKLNKISNTFILGSDNLINLETNYFPFVANCLFNYTDNDKKRIMISGSIGSWNGSTKNEEEHNYIKYLLDRFDYISTREEQGKNVFKNVYDVDSDWINDPVFYLEKQDFIDLTKNINDDYSNNIMQYILYPTVKTDKIVKHYKKLLGSQVVKFDGNENVKYFSFDKNQSVENWLKAIQTSQLIITDSFHCVAFCLIFNKKFVCIKNSHATVRFTSLFKRLGIDIPLIEDINDLETINFNYDKDAVNQSLTDIRKYALEKIQISLDKPKKNVTSNFEMDNFNKNYIKNNEKWYKKNRIFYFFVIVPIVIPVKKIWANIKNG